MAKRSGKNKKASTRGRSPKQPILAPRDELRDGGPKTGALGHIGVIFAVALAVRALFFFLNKQNSPLFYNPIMDSLYHHEWATRIISGEFWGNEVFFRAPLYPYFLALLYKVSGSSIAFAVFVQHIMGAGSTVLVYLLSRQFFSSSVSLVAGLTAALYWPFIYYEGDLLIVTMIIFLDLLALILLTIALKGDRASLYFVTGIVVGLSAIARPNILALLPVIPFAVHFTRSPGRSSKLRAPWITRSALVFAGVLVAVMPVVVRNYVVGRDFVPIASQGGVNFYIGNNPVSDGRTAIVPGTRWDWWGGYEDALQIAEKDMGRSLKPSEVSNYYFRKGFRFIVSEPGKAVRLFARKFYIFWAAGERSNNKYIYFFWNLSGMGKVPLPGFWLIGPLGLLGGVLLWRMRRELSLLYLFTASYMLGVVAFFVNARFRLPVVPVLIIFAAYAALHLLATARRNRSGLWVIVPVLFLCVFVVDVDLLTFKENKPYADSISRCTLGNAYLKMGNTDRAVEEYEAAIAVDRKYPTDGYQLVSRNVNFNLGKIYWARGSCPKAIPLLERVGGDDRHAIQARGFLADCYAREGRFREAIGAYESVLRLDAADKNAHLGLSEVYVKLGETAKAVEQLRRARALHPDDPTIDSKIRSIEKGP